jgi:hypothetical protein
MVPESQMFSTLQGFSPTNRPISLPMSHKNMINYVKFIQIRQEFFPEIELGEKTKKCMQTKQFAEAFHEVMRQQAN